MPSDVQERKLQRHFELLDMDRNGFIEQQDLVAFADKITESAGASGTPQAQAFRSEAERVWQSLRKALDQDGDQRVSRDEFVSAADINQVMNEAVKLGHLSFDVIDRDGDGRISKAEWTRMDQSIGIPREDSMAGFEQLDRDGDGYISRDEYTRGVEEFYRSDNPSAGGNWVLGTF
ncbi:EF-hand domain-containing protein [Streptomyces sp. YH02]|uniref:EF-hand domain-containing protein n=1 Tax=Streptomyces sp. YH02 TaxID=3256999 RepID=UPI0037563285